MKFITGTFKVEHICNKLPYYRKLPYCQIVTIISKGYHIAQKSTYCKKVTIFQDCYHIVVKLPYRCMVNVTVHFLQSLHCTMTRIMDNQLLLMCKNPLCAGKRNGMSH